MQLLVTARALKDLKKVPAPDREAILSKLETYAATGQGDVKKLVGREQFRLRHGDWRAIFERRSAVIVLTVLNRREAYR